MVPKRLEQYEEVTPAILKRYRELPFEEWVNFLNANKNSKQLRRLLTMCPMIDPEEYGLDEGVEPTSVKGGEEHKLIITSVNEGTDKNGLDYLMPVLEIVGEPYSKDFSYFLHVPSKDKMGAKKLNQARYNYSTFCTTFGIDLSRPFDPVDDWPGHEGWAILGAKESDEFGDQNFVKKLLAPK